MMTSPPTGPAWFVDVGALRRDAVEHAMRLSDDEAHVLPLLFGAPQGRGARAALARIVTVSRHTPPPDSPLMVWCYGGMLSPDWRELVPALPTTLWSELEMLAALAAVDISGCALDLLLDLRDAA